MVNYIFSDVATVVNFTWAAGNTESPLIPVSPDSDGTGTKALRMLCLPGGFPTSTLEIFVSPDSNGANLYKLWDGDGINAGIVQIPITQSPIPIGLTMRPHWTDSVRSLLFLSSVAMPDDFQCKAILQPIYKGGQP